MSEAEKDTREWTMYPYVTGSRADQTRWKVEPPPTRDECGYRQGEPEPEVKVVAAAALSAVEAERDEAMKGPTAKLDAILIERVELAEAAFSGALDLIERLLGSDWRTIPEEQLSEDEQAARRLLLGARETG